ncbi:hypothetical protein FRC12_008836 [Ceratobasidium sp. 428]|nr:hypothetical protein FRC12_008836 [Ceratobasidium sp. 428]
MHTFTHIAAFVFILFSLSFLVSAIPTAPRTLGAIYPPAGEDAISAILIKLCLRDLEVKIKALLGCGTLPELKLAIKVLIGLFQPCADELLKVDANVTISAKAKASIVTCVCSIITLLVKVCAEVSVKFGIVVVVDLFAELDVCLKALLVNLNICIAGVLVLIVKTLAQATVGLLFNIHFELCSAVLGLKGIAL